MTLPWEFLIQKCDTIMPRYYTIASSSVVLPDQIRIAISLSTYKTFDGSDKLGLTSKFLKEMMKEGVPKNARIFVKNSNFDMNNNVPLLMVGPGTGIVPFIAFAEEREHMIANGESIGEGHLFFGCREKDNDFIYRDFFASKLDNKVIKSFNLAFSRPQDGTEKQYVQDVLGKQVELIERLII